MHHSNGQAIEIASPDGSLKVNVLTNKNIEINVSKGHQTIIEGLRPAMQLVDGRVMGQNIKLRTATTNKVDQLLDVAVPSRASAIRDRYNEANIKFRGKYSFQVRVFDEGWAYRFATDMPDEILIHRESMNLNTEHLDTVYFPKESSMISHYERSYLHIQPNNLKEGSFASLPVLFKTNSNVSVLFTEADLYDYPGSFLTKSSAKTMELIQPKVVLSAIPNPDSPDRNEKIQEQATYVARTNGSRTFPWRVFIIVDHDGELISQNLVYQLSRENQLEDTGWIKPGKVAWDWWNALNIDGVDFKSGINTVTYKYYIDFAAAFKLDYIILDEGWAASTTDIIHTNPDIDIKELVSYGAGKNVGVILWTLWKPLDKAMEEVMDTYQNWGIKGIKVDFMQRTDQYMVNYYERVVREAARHHLLVDFHGAFKPAGLRRSYPNLVNYEGVKGLEHSKWSKDITPTHDLEIPFIRMAAGPMDFTPGAMDNAHESNFSIRFSRPMAMGTRCHQMAMYVVYEAPLQMLADSPSNYYREKECTGFISNIPTSWDETRVLDGRVGQYVAVARRQGDTWYIGAMNGKGSRKLHLDLGFLPEGTYDANIFQDGINAETIARDYKHAQQTLHPSSPLEIKMASGGGWVAIVTKR